ncbi:EamA family transporter [Candidatus Woesearchaeota archaeon]|nr:EamA family transporter [Candidatus Woesearchaeota archaeon]
MPTELWAAGLVVLGTIVGSFGPILLKKGSKKFSLNPRLLIKNHYITSGTSLYILGTILFIAALRGGELSILYPLVSVTYIWVSFLSIKFLKEKMNKYKWLGILLIIMGVTFIGIGA